MNKMTIGLLEYNKIKERLKEYAVSDLGRQMADRLQPSVDTRRIEAALRETTEAKALVNLSSSIPLHSLTGIQKLIDKTDKGIILNPEELSAIADFLVDVKRIKKFMKERENIAPHVCSYALSMYELEEIKQEIENCIVDARVHDKASAEISRVRKKMAVVDSRIKNKLDSILKSSVYRKYLQDNIVSVRGGRYVIPIKSEYRNSIKGLVTDSSASGSTLFIEPEEIRNLQDELGLLKIQEEREVYRILSYLTGIIGLHFREMSINQETMASYDFAFAKAKYSREIGGNTVKHNHENYINLIEARHPLIGKSAVPLHFSIGRNYRSFVITGPNTGGKTVALKTVGLLTMMAQSGLHVPVKEGSELAVFNDILVDIGDGQSIEQSLSSFSSHIRNIKTIIDCADTSTLIILDELGAGTDPGEGMGLAISILESLHERGATVIATTHYSEIKKFAKDKDGFENGCMEFDINTLKPLYRLKTGESGESNAFLIALRLGLDQKIVERAHEITYKKTANYLKPLTETTGYLIEAAEIKEVHDRQTKRAHEIRKISKKVEQPNSEKTFKLGDCVIISSLGKTGIVYELENGKGEVGVMYDKKKIKVNRKRLSLYIDAKELYPTDYDMNIIFESKENRKKQHLMNRKHVKGLTIERHENE